MWLAITGLKLAFLDNQANTQGYIQKARWGSIMTDYSLIATFHASLELLSQTIMDYASVLFAFIVAGYLIGDKLKSSMVVILVILFTAMAFSQFINMYYLQSDLAAISEYMVRRTNEGLFTLPNLQMAQHSGGFYHVFLKVAIIGSYFAALIFFFHQRRTGLGR